MPYQTIWTEPDELLTHQDVTIYHAYADDEYDEPCRYHFVTRPSEGRDMAFDVRALKAWHAEPVCKPGEDFSRHETRFMKHLHAVLKAAITSGELNKINLSTQYK